MSLIDLVREERAKIVAPADEVIAKAEAEKRDLTAAEFDTIKKVADAAKPLDERIAELSDFAARSAAAAAAMPNIPARVKHEERTYNQRKSQTGESSFFADSYAAQAGDVQARARLERHANEVRVEREATELRAVATSGFASAVVPQYLTELAAVVLRNGRPTANVCRRLPLPAQGMTLNIPRGTTGASVTSQATENSAASSTDEVWTNLSVPVVTVAGQQDVSRQSLERGFPGLDELIYLDLAGAYHAQIDAQVLNGSGSSGQMLGIINTGSIGAATAFGAAPSATNFQLKVAGQIASVNAAGAQVQPNYIIISPRRWGWLNSLVDSSNRPLVVPSNQGPFNVAALLEAIGSSSAAGEGSQVSTSVARVVGTLQGMPVIVDPNMPTAVGTNNEDIVVVGDFNQAILWEEGDGMPRLLRFEQTTGGSLTTKLVTYGYAAFTAGRYPTAFGKVGGLDTGGAGAYGLVAPSF